MTLTPSLLDTDSSVGTGGCVLDASGAAEDDLLLVQIIHNGSAPTTPTGWALRNTQAGSFGHSLSTYERRAESPETSYTFTHGGDSGAVLVGVHGDAGVPTFDDLASDEDSGASTVVIAPGVDLSDDGVIVCTWVQVATGSTITDPVSMTALQSGDLFRSQATSWEAVTAGATGTRTANATGNATWLAVTVGVIEVTAAAVTAAVEHGIVLGHQVAAESTVEASVEHGIVLGHQVAGQVVGGATVRHGLIFGHEVEFEVRIPVDMAVEHGIVFGHAVVFDVEREITTRPIQPMADLRPLQPMFTSTP